MAMIRYSLSILLVLFSARANLQASQETVRNARTFPRDSSQRSLPLARCATGISTFMELGGVSRSVNHNGNDGEAHFVLKKKSDGSVLWKDEFIGEGICLGFNARKRVYVIGSRKEHGIGVRLTNVRYIGEAARVSHVSVFNTKKMEAFAAIASPDLHYVAFVGLDGNDSALFVLDIEKDSIRKLGKAPLPPPLTPEEREFVSKHPETLEGQWEWMASFRDSYMELDPGIILFQKNNVVKVSYGEDTAYQRTQRRNTVTWDLRRRQPNKAP